MVQFHFGLNPKFQASSNHLWLYSTVCVGPGRNPEDGFSRNEAHSFHRLSRYTSNQLADNNPNIADLGDINRPTKLAEKFAELYDNEWTEAFEFITKDIGLDEEKAIKELLQTLQVAKNYPNHV